MMRFRALCLMLVCAFVGRDAGAEAVGETQRAKERVVLSVYSIPSKDVLTTDARAQRAIFDRFLETHPDIEVVWQVEQLQAEGPMGESTELMAMAAETAPDVLYSDAKKIGTFKDQGFFLPLDEHLARWAEENGRPFLGNSSADDVWGSAVQDGHVWAIPFRIQTLSIMYRRDLFTKAGLDPDSPPQTWDEFYRFARRLSDDTDGDGLIDQYGYAIKEGSKAGGWHFVCWVWSAGGEVVRPYKVDPTTGQLVEVPPPHPDFRKFHIQIGNEEQYARRVAGYPEDPLPEVKELQWRLILDEQPGIDALEFYRRLVWSEWTRCPDCGEEFDITPEMKRGNEVVCAKCGKRSSIEDLRSEKRFYVGVAKVGEDMEAFVKGKHAMTMGTSGLSDMHSLIETYGFDPEQVGLFNIPGKERGMGVNQHDSSYMALNSTLKNAPQARQDAAWEYIRFWTSDEAYRIMTKTYVESGMAKLIRPYWLERFGYTDYLREVPKHWVEADRNLDVQTKSEPYAKNWKHVETVELAIPLDAVLLNNADPRSAMEKCVNRVNSMIMRVQVEQSRAEKGLSAVLMAVFLAAIGYLFFRIAKSRTGARDAGIPRAGFGGARVQRHLKAWMFMLPAVLTVVLWQYIPLIRGSYMAFWDYRLLGGSKWVGFGNFATILLQPDFYRYVLVTLYYLVLTLSLGFLAPIVLAVLLSEVPRLKILFRTVYLLPAVTTGLVILFLWKTLLYGPEATGVLNRIVGLFGVSPQRWLQDSKLAMLCIIVPGVWGGVGMGSLIYLAAMKSIPEEHYEAADLDGAGIWKKFRHITYPGLKALIIINFVGAFVGAFRGIENIFAMTGGGPGISTRTIAIDIWSNAFLYLKFGYATAEGWILGLFLIGFTVYQLRVLGKVRFRAALKA